MNPPPRIPDRPSNATRTIGLPALLAALALTCSVRAANLPPVKVFILAGQSNMEGHGFIAADSQRNGGKGSLEHFAKGDGRSHNLFDPEDQWELRDDVWITYLDRHGPLTAGYGARADRIVQSWGSAG
jgi:alpha-galactosidase